MVQHLSPSASKVYQLSGTQKFEIPKSEIRNADVFQAVEAAKRKFTVFAWGLADTNMEDVFIKVSREARQSNTLTWLLDAFNDSCNLLWYQSYFKTITIPYCLNVVIIMAIKHFLCSSPLCFVCLHLYLLSFHCKGFSLQSMWHFKAVNRKIESLFIPLLCGLTNIKPSC